MRDDITQHTTRRNVLRTTGAAIVGGVAASSVATAAPSPDDFEDEGFQFDRVINVVDAGADPTGEELVDPIIEEYAEDNTLLYFPEGDYKLFQFINNTADFGEFDLDSYYPLDNFGLLGAGSDRTTIVVPEGRGSGQAGSGMYHKVMFELRYGKNQLIEGFQIDHSAPNTGGRFNVWSDGDLVVRDLHAHGVIDVHMTCFSFGINEQGEEGIVQNVRAPDGATHPGGGVEATGIAVPAWHEGDITIRDCRVEGFQDNGLYASNPSDPATVRVEGGYYANSNISQVRLGQSGSYVKNATVAVTEKIDTDYTVNMRGIRQQDGEGVTVKNCDVVYTADAPSSGAIVTETRTGELTVENSRVRVGDPATVPAIRARTPTADFDTEAMTIENVSITGDATGGSAVQISNRAGNTLKNVCIEESGDGRDGITFDGSSGTVRNAAIDVQGQQIVATDDDNVETRNVRDRANCNGPTLR